MAWGMPTEKDFLNPNAGVSMAAQQKQQGGIGSVATTPQGQQKFQGQASAPSSGYTGGRQLDRPTTGWMSNLNQMGIQSAATDEDTFFRDYGTYGQGSGSPWEPGGNLGAFFAETFNPRATAAVSPFSGPSKYTDPEDIVMGQSNLMDKLTQNGTILDPSAVIGNTMAALSSVKNVDDLMKINPTLAAVLNSSTTGSGQINALLSFLSDALAGSMPEDILRSFMATLNRVSQQFAQQQDTMDVHGGGSKQLDLPSLARFLTSQFGPTLGI